MSKYLTALLIFFTLAGSGCSDAPTDIKTGPEPVKHDVPEVTATNDASPIVTVPAVVPTTPPVAKTIYRVTYVVDGDTVEVTLDGVKTRLRLIGIDSPETKDPRKPVQCFGAEASAYATKLLLNKDVQLEADESQGELDKYDRTLRYIILSDGTNFGEKMIRDGYAHEYTYDAPYKYQAAFKSAQQEAMKNKRGLWSDSTCAGDTTKAAAAPAPVAPSTAPAATSTTTPTTTPATSVPAPTTTAPTPTAVTPTPPPPPPANTTTSAPCSCASDSRNCTGDTGFSSRAAAQSCFEYCWSSTGRDVHRLDADHDGEACESLK